ncbi:MAG: prepilin-type N-terminal cleavage/methylation domain-containing protein, partial [Terriglobales bacterium]
MPTPSLLRRRRRSCGFSLIELLIAVAIIMIIIGGSVPMLKKTRQNALE